ncbi:MAG: TRAP transporter large permease [Betaproteobacteria bacterium]|nr:TRAP transporter large permease [Betaproteobacteria bacterium]MBK7083046.1 TRAP transporter large permease [Betaproteobacteria bacterium]MBK7590624.1 TRAP transporter large permease [Betaproteobacteria bacterium]MBK8689822.1 TRAP transporter large permease [Betaproteobacteria bacterium]MBK9674080.1 TRAP transporter large permease [Betaproteobacteria bacterium]
MTPGFVAALMFGVLFAALLVRIPVAFALAIACVPPLALDPRLDLTVLVSTMFTAFNSFLLLAVPFFLLAANLMNTGGITDRLFNWTRSMVGHLPGSLAQINVVLSVLFAGVSGSSTADAASQAKLFINAQVKEGYDMNFSIAITAVSAILAVIIPPSILMIVWGGVFNTSINQLFMAGVLPGLLLGGVQMLIVYAYAKLRHYPTYERATFRQFLRTTAIAIPAMFTPGIIVGGKLMGWFTATESGAMAVLYALFLAGIVYREIGWKQLKTVLFDTGTFSAISLFCLGTASVFGWLLAYYKIPQALVAFIAAYQLGPVAMGLVIAGVFLSVGCFLDAIPAIIIVGTVLEPMVATAGIDPVHFGIISIVALAFGLITPPYGLCLLVSCAAVNVKVVNVLKDITIMLAPMLLVLLAIVLLPDVFLFLPRLVTEQGFK